MLRAPATRLSRGAFAPCAAPMVHHAGVAARAFSAKPVKMTHSEAFVESLRAQKVDTVFGIVGSAFMDSLDLFPSAGIRFISVQHEQNSAHMADGYARVSGKCGVVIGQNGPGITNSVTAIAAAYWAHSPVIMITPEAATMTKGFGGFQESDNLEIFKSIVKAQCHVVNPMRMAEMTGRAFHLAQLENGPVQLNIPRDYFYGEGEHLIPEPRTIERSSGGPQALQEAFDLLSKAERPALILGGGSVLSGATAAAAQLAEKLGIPAASTYLHNDSFPKSHPCSVGPIGYLGSKAAMWSVRDADVILAVGTRLNPFCTNPQYGMNYFPQDAKIVQVEVDQRRLGFTKKADVEVLGDARLFVEEMLKRIDANPSTVKCIANRDAGMKQIAKYKAEWKTELDAMTDDVTGVHVPRDGFMKPRQVLRELTNNMPENAVVTTDIGNICSVANGYITTDHPRHFLGPMSFGNCGYSSPAAMGAKVARPDLPCVAFSGEGAWGMQLMDTLTSVRENIPITVCVFNNGQWGAEKKNQVLWFGDRYVGTNLESPSFAGIAESMGVVGVKITNIDEVGPALKAATKRQMEEGKTTVIELMCTKELGDPFRRDAMKLPKRSLERYKSTEEMEESRTQQPTDPRA